MLHVELEKFTVSFFYTMKIGCSTCCLMVPGNLVRNRWLFIDINESSVPKLITLMWYFILVDTVLRMFEWFGWKSLPGFMQCADFALQVNNLTFLVWCFFNFSLMPHAQDTLPPFSSQGQPGDALLSPAMTLLTHRAGVGSCDRHVAGGHFSFRRGSCVQCLSILVTGDFHLRTLIFSCQAAVHMNLSILLLFLPTPQVMGMGGSQAGESTEAGAEQACTSSRQVRECVRCRHEADVSNVCKCFPHIDTLCV